MTMDQATLQERLDALRDKAGLPGAAVGVLHGDDVVEAASGVLDVETGRPLTIDTAFHLASVTKVYTATLVMTLVDEGRIDLDAPLRTYLPDFTVVDDTASTKLTMRHLLTHTSGIDGDKMDSFGRGDDALARYVDSCRTLRQTHPVGATYSYCNSGLNIAGRVVEVLTGMSWDDALRERVLTPIGAHRSGTLAEDVVCWPFAVPHVDDEGTSVPLRTWQGDRASGPCGGVIATVRDVLRFAALHDRGGVAEDGTRVLSEDAVREMVTPQFTLPEGTGDDTHAGLGWAMRQLPDGRWQVGHGGDLVGTHAVLERVPAERLTVVVLANGDHIGQVANPLLEEILGGVGVPSPTKPQRPTTPPHVDVAARAGTFRTVAVQIDLVAAGDHLDGTLRIRDEAIAARFPESQRQQSITLYPVTDDRWLVEMPGADELMPAVFSDSDGRRYLHMGGRAAVAD